MAQFYGYYGGYSYNVPPPYPGPYGGPRPYGYGYGPDPYARTGPQPLPPRVVTERLEQQGYEDVSRLRFTGTLYIVDATAPGDMRMRVVVDAIRGVILDRTVLGERRAFGLREDLDEERRDARPPRPAPERRREVSRTPVDPAPGALATPADPRLAPGDSGGAALAEPRRPPSARSATRTAPASPKPAIAPEGSTAPYGVNPETSPRRKAVDPKSPVDAKNPAGTPPARPTTEAETRSGKPPVRVIEGVTPSNSGGASARPAPTPPAANPLDTLPQPPAAEAPTGLN